MSSNLSKFKNTCTVAKNLKFIRSFHNLTQKTAASKINVKLGTYAAWEECRATPKIQNLIELSDISGFTIDDILRKDLKKEYKVRITDLIIQKNFSKPIKETIDGVLSK